MNHAGTDILERIQSLRASFDQAFAEPIARRHSLPINLLAVRVGGEHLALRIDDLAGISLDRKCIALAGSIPQLAGVAGMRGKLLAVYRLGALLDCEGKAGSEPWIAQCREDPSVGLSFDELESHIRADPTGLHTVVPGEGHTKHVKEFLRDGSTVRAVVNIPLVLQSIHEMVKAGQQR